MIKPETVFNWSLAIIICLLLGSSYLLDGPSDIEAMTDVQAAVEELQTLVAEK